MKKVRVVTLSTSVVLLCILLGQAQQRVSTVANGMVPPLVQFSNVATDDGGTSLSGVVSITFSLYNSQQGGEPLWTETQNNVQLDATGHYSVQLGITKPAGVPTTLFTTGEARWMGVRIDEQPEQPRSLFLSVPYALKAGDATTIGGLPPSAFVLAGLGTGSGETAVANGATTQGVRPAFTGTGTTNYIPLWLSKTKLGSSVLFQNATTGNVGVGTITPAATLDVNGAVNAAISYNLGGTAFAYGSFANGNAFLGFAGNSTMTGTDNAAGGVGTLASNTTGANNAGYGYQALYLNTTGNDNTAIGEQTLYHNSSGNDNTATGFGSLFANTTGVNNTAAGWGALQDNTSGGDNTAVGSGALYFNSTGGSNTAIGYEALMQNSSSNSTAVGWSALYSNQTGVDNTATGFGALYSNISGSYNTANGVDALYKSTVSYDTAIGYAVLAQNTTGTYNTATGFNALTANTTGTNNTTSGTYTLANNTTGSYNTATGVSALADNTTGIENTATGAFACQTQTTGTDITCNGYATEAVGQNLRNATAIGAHAMVTVSDAVVLGSVAGVNGAKTTARVGIGTTSPTNLLTLGQGFGPSLADGWATYSSRRWKTNIQTLHGALDKVERLRGVSYNLKASGQHEVGVIAEEVGAVVPELVTYEANGKDARSVDYSRLTALLIEATKEQQALIRHQQKLIRAQHAQIVQLASQVQTIQASLSLGRQALETRTAILRTNPRQ
ncbi:MAG: tail fiber domain-containing protein [Terriglobales bacterium]